MQQPINNNKQQTAVEWFAEQIESGKIEIVYSDKIHSIKCIPEIIQQAKELEKQQIMEAVYDSMGTNFDPNMGRAEQYYNETYNN
jgi:hypothetical protein